MTTITPVSRTDNDMAYSHPVRFIVSSVKDKPGFIDKFKGIWKTVGQKPSSYPREDWMCIQLSANVVCGGVPHD